MVRDHDNETVALLREIARKLGSGQGPNTDVDVEESTKVLKTENLATGKLAPRAYRIVETDNLDAANNDGTITLEPGDTKTIAGTDSYEDGVAVLAVGATDATDVQFYLEVDNSDVVGGLTQSPLGTINSPFSFPESLGATIPASSTAAYKAVYPESATGTVDLTARLHTVVR